MASKSQKVQKVDGHFCDTVIAGGCSGLTVQKSPGKLLGDPGELSRGDPRSFLEFRPQLFCHPIHPGCEKVISIYLGLLETDPYPQ